MRLEAEIKMGYYPTPLSVVERIRTFIRFPDDNVNLLDPCCGDGSGLKNLKGDAKATTYGIELDQNRANKAKKNLDHVLKGSLKYLQPSGLLVYLIPQKELTEDAAIILSYRFANFQVFRFPDEEYEPFKQIVLFGSKKSEAAFNEHEYDRLKTVPYRELLEIPFMEEPLYNLPPSGPVQLFRSSLISEEELERELEESTLWQKIKESAEVTNDSIGKPPLPLHKGHIGLLLANGCLDGIVGEGDDRHIVRGKVEKVVSRYEEFEDDIKIEREVESYRVYIKILKRDGEVIHLM